VIVWDRGTYRNLTEKDGKMIPVPKAIEAGHVKVWLEGKKLTGGFALTRVGGGKKPRWLLVKVDDGEASIRRNPVKTEPGSILSGRTNEEIAAQRRPQSESPGLPHGSAGAARAARGQGTTGSRL